MNAAATQDLRATDVWPAIRAVLRTGNAPSARAEAAAGLVDSWRGMGASRIDGDLDGKVDHPGAAVMDEAWPRLADAVMTPVLGPLVDRLARLMARSHDPSPAGRPTSRAGTATSTRICERCSTNPCAARTRAATAVQACSRRAGKLSGARSTPPQQSSRRLRALRLPRGERTRRASAFASRPVSCRTRCAGRTARPSSRSCRSPATGRGARPRERDAQTP